MVKKLILNSAYFLQTSKRYQSVKRFFYDLLENDTYKYKKYIDYLMITLIFISVGVLIREVKYHVDDFLLFFSNYIISIIFFIEYMLRLWVYSSVSKTIVSRAEHDSFLSRDVNLLKAFTQVLRRKFSYIFSLQAIIDLLAILPFFHELRLLRTFILFRVFKLFRYAKSFQTLTGVLAIKKFEFLTLAVFASIVIFVSSVFIYVMEANNPNSPIDTLYEALYWSVVTISTVGYGDITPTTTEGRFVSMLVITAGVGVLALSTSLVVSAFTERLDEIKEVKNIENIAHLQNYYLVCGYDNIAKELTKKLQRGTHKVIVLDENPLRIEEARKDGLLGMNYSSGSTESYKKLNIDIKKRVKAVLCLHEDDIKNVYTALTVRSIDKDIFILSLLMKNTNRKKLEFAGINNIVYPQELVGLITKELVGQPAAFEVIHQLRSEYTNVEIDEIVVTQKVLENFATVGSLGNKHYKVIVLGLFKGAKERFYFNPIDSTILENGDFILAIGYKTFLKEFEKSLYKKAKYV